MGVESRHDPAEGVTPDGMITTGACAANVSPGFRIALDRAVEAVQGHGDAHSLYVYGSVATGTASAGHSDVDLVTIGLEPHIARSVAHELSASFAKLCRGAEIGAAQPQDYAGDRDEAFGNRAFLRHYCVHLAGPDLAKGLPAVRADAAAARGFNGDIGARLARWREDARSTTTTAAPFARRIARKTLFAVTGLVSVHDATWTTDRVRAAARWSLVQPSLGPALETLVRWGDAASSDLSMQEIQAMLDGCIAKVAADFASRIGLWQ